jgi:uncharacterized protein
LSMKSRFKPFVLLLVAALVLCSSIAWAAVDIPAQPADYVVDQAGVINDGTERKLDAYLKELEQKTTAQFVILTIRSLEGASLEDFSITVANDRWHLGQKGKDNGVLLLVAVQDHKYRIEVGYGLEGILPDSLVGTIGREYLVPFFRKGDYSEGIYRAALSIANVIASNAGVTITGMPRPTRPVPVRKRPSLFSTLISVLFFILLGIFAIRNPRLFLLLLLTSSMGGRRGGSWGGGGFGGGGFGGGFGGGGGGGFGGGGASGSW